MILKCWSYQSSTRNLVCTFSVLNPLHNILLKLFFSQLLSNLIGIHVFFKLQNILFYIFPFIFYHVLTYTSIVDGNAEHCIAQLVIPFSKMPLLQQFSDSHNFIFYIFSQK